MTDVKIKHYVLEALEYEPMLNATQISVAVNKGIVTLSGQLDSQHEKVIAEATAACAKGVKGIVSELKVAVASKHSQCDAHIARQALAMIAWDIGLPRDSVEIHVDNGWVTLDGSVDWYPQSRAVETLVRALSGVAGLTNRINTRTHPNTEEVQRRLLAAFQSHPELDASGIRLSAFGGKVTLDGTVHGLHERALAARVAWSTPGVTYVEDVLTVLGDRPKDFASSLVTDHLLAPAI